MSRTTLIQQLKLVLPYPCHWYEEQSTHQLQGMYSDRRREISEARVRLAFEADDRRIAAQLKRKPLVLAEDNGLPF